jgi:hypothetical protein
MHDRPSRYISVRGILNYIRRKRIYVVIMAWAAVYLLKKGNYSAEFLI